MNIAQDNAPLDRDEQAALWCVSLSEGELSGDARAAFDIWITDSDNARAFEEAARVWDGTDNASAMPELIQMRTAALESFRKANRQRWAKGLSASWYWATAIVATLLVAILAAAMFYAPAQIFQTGVGERRIAMLRDGSKLSLDADTEVEVRLSKDRRELTLIRGRAKFDVAKDPLRPFTVTAGSKMVVATGTSFSVEVLDSQVHVLLYEGHVVVLDKTADRPIVQKSQPSVKAGAAGADLTPGRELTANLETMAPAVISDVDLVRSLSWESGQLSFDDEPLPAALARMNRYSSEKLVIGDQRLTNIRVNGVFSAGDNAAFIEGVTALNPITAVREPGKIILKSN